MTKTPNTPTLPETGYMRLPAILKFFPIGKSTWWAKVKSGEYPQPVKLGPRTTAWRVEDIRTLLQRVGQPFTPQAKTI